VRRFPQLVFVAAVLMTAYDSASARQEIPADYQAVLKTIGKSGDFKDGVLKVNIPRNDLTVTIKGARLLPHSDLADGWHSRRATVATTS
jgi:hypothetical protein